MTTDDFTAYLRANFSYDRDTGIFTRTTTLSSRAKAGDTPGYLTHNGYIRFSVLSKEYPAHRLAWLYCYGAWPEGDIDHIDTVKSHNWIANLRECNRSQNVANTKLRSTNTSGYKGVHIHRTSSGNYWRAVLTVNYKDVHLGYFNTAEEAHQAYCAGAAQYFGEHARYK